MSVKCPNCLLPINLKGLRSGAQATCSSCGATLTVPKAKMPNWLRRIVILVAGLGLAIVSVFTFFLVMAAVSPRTTEAQSECVTQLKLLYQAEMSQPQGFSSVLYKVGFSPPRGNRYAYFAGRGPMEDRSGPELAGTQEAQAIGVDTYRLPDQRPITVEDLPRDLTDEMGAAEESSSLVMVCAGNLDDDSTLDVWSISTDDRRVGILRTLVLAGRPYHHVNDLGRW
jgi:type IV pilus assembly protein PilA